TGRIAQPAGGRHMIGVRMRFDDIAQREPEPAQQAHVALEALLDGVDEDRFARCAVDEHVRERRRLGVEELMQFVVHAAFSRPHYATIAGSAHRPNRPPRLWITLPHWLP